MVRRSTAALRIDVLPKPAEYTAATWLPVRDLTVEESWSTPPEGLRVGESTTRTITITALGAQGAQLPPIQFPPSDGLKYYPDQPRITEEEVPGGLLGIREDSAALVPTRAGNYRIPELRIPWGDVQSEKIRYAVVPEREITIKPAAPQTTLDSAMPVAPTQDTASMNVVTRAPARDDNLLWPIVAATSTAGWLLTLVYVWRLRRTAPRMTPTSTDDSSISEQRAFKQLQAACASGRPSAARNALINWAARLESAKAPTSLDEVAALFHDAKLTEELRQIDAALFSADEIQWQGTSLADCLTKVRGAWQVKHQKPPQSFHLYPQAQAN